MTKITDHAAQRIKKRIGSKNPEKDFSEALLHGIKLNQTKGRLRQFLNQSARKHQSDAIVHKGFIFWHRQTTLITVTPLPQRFIKYVRPKEA